MAISSSQPMLEVELWNAAAVPAKLPDTLVGSPPNFSIALIEKDLAYAIREGAEVGIDLLSAEAARVRFQQAQTQGFGGRDIAWLVKWLGDQPHSKDAGTQ